MRIRASKLTCAFCEFNGQQRRPVYCVVYRHPAAFTQTIQPSATLTNCPTAVLSGYGSLNATHQDREAADRPDMPSPRATHHVHFGVVCLVVGVVNGIGHLLQARVALGVPAQSRAHVLTAERTEERREVTKSPTSCDSEERLGMKIFSFITSRLYRFRAYRLIRSRLRKRYRDLQTLHTNVTETYDRHKDL